jgi:hypothetical protein
MAPPCRAQNVKRWDLWWDWTSKAVALVQYVESPCPEVCLLSRFAYFEFLCFELLCVIKSIHMFPCCNSIGFPHFGRNPCCDRLPGWRRQRSCWTVSRCPSVEFMGRLLCHMVIIRCFQGDHQHKPTKKWVHHCSTLINAVSLMVIVYINRTIETYKLRWFLWCDTVDAIRYNPI